MKTLYLRIVVTTIVVMIFSSSTFLFPLQCLLSFYLKPHNDEKVTRMAKDIQSYYQNHSSIDINQYLSHISQLGYQMYLVASDGNGTFYGGDFRKKNWINILFRM